MRELSHDEAHIPIFPAVLERAVRMVQEHQGEHSAPHPVIRSIASKAGCSREILRNWIKEAENGISPASDERDRIEALEREVRELGQGFELSEVGKA